MFYLVGLPYTTAIYMRWVSGLSCTVLCYPVLQAYGLDSHFLPLLPVAIAMFAALGVVLAFKKRRMIMAVRSFFFFFLAFSKFVLTLNKKRFIFLHLVLTLNKKSFIFFK